MRSPSPPPPDRLELEQILEHAARADRRELVDVADEQHVRARPDGRQQRLREMDGEHRRLVDDQHVAALDRVLRVAREALLGRPLQQPVDRRRLDAGQLAEPPRRLAGRRAQPRALAVRLEQVDERAHRRALAGARPAGEDRQAVLERLRDAVPLVVAGHERPAHGALDGAQRQRRVVVEQAPHVPREALLDRVQPCLADPPRVVGDDPAACREPVDRLLDVDAAAEQARRPRRELRAGKMAVAVGLRLVERVQHARRQAVGGVQRRVERARQRVGGREADPVELADRVGLALQPGDRARAEVTRDPARRRRVDAVRVEEQAQLAQLALVAPGLHGGAEAAGADAGYAAQHALRIAVDGGEHLACAIAVDEQRGPARADVLDGLQVGGDGGVADRLEDPHALDAELPPVAWVAAPAAAGRDRLALAHVRERADEHDRLAFAGDRVEHREVAVGNAPAHAHDLRDQLRGRGIARRGVLLAVRHRAQCGMTP